MLISKSFMQTVSIEQKLEEKLHIILQIAHLLKEKIDHIIGPIATESYVNSNILKELQDLPIDKFILLSREALSEFNASACENSPLSIPVTRIIEKFTEIKILINPNSYISKKTFFTAAVKVDLQRLQENLTAVNEVFNMLSHTTPILDVSAERSFRGLSPGS
ncbi:MAG: hypothetical protein WAL30_01785 [Candidatus Aquirickettsiella sp.]